MKLGLANHKVDVVKHDPAWRQEFARSRSELALVTEIPPTQIDHIGSTAILDMPAKPIIDIVLGIEHFPHVSPKLIDALKSVGFLRLKVEKQDEMVFAKFTDDSYQVKTHYLHLTQYQGQLWRDWIQFRDRLNGNAELRSEYLALKFSLVKQAEITIEKYTDAKTDFVRKVINEWKTE
ncbi:MULTISPECIES: GrpB family protein [unclassified Vibrio]|uniref:GrpB family protein n=1 Tax=unclassified Vibrio TaxID=2614977 RepID=UPI00255421AC|nr:MULTISPECIES: GrpB family protein [unclassified Vibrio]MDK9776726.1 GrpB family protein [Vibrio sp. D401a]MDK9808356.1 GrpB family protein [Vibrio sp. D406a]